MRKLLFCPCSDRVRPVRGRPGLAQSSTTLKPEELDQLVAPIALYPDTLLSQVLIASTYPLEVVEAERWAQQNKNLKGDALKKAVDPKKWDDSVKSLAATPDVLDDDVGQARLDPEARRRRAGAAARCDGCDSAVASEGAGQRQAQDQQAAEGHDHAAIRQDYIAIEPAEPKTVYVPYYDPAVVYGAWPYPVVSALLFPGTRLYRGCCDRHRRCFRRRLRGRRLGAWRQLVGRQLQLGQQQHQHQQRYRYQQAQQLDPQFGSPPRRALQQRQREARNSARATIGNRRISGWISAAAMASRC